MDFYHNDPMEYEYTQSVKAPSTPHTPVNQEIFNNDGIVEQLDNFTLDDLVQNQQEPNSRPESTEMINTLINEPTCTPTKEEEEHAVVPFKPNLTLETKQQQQQPIDTPSLPVGLNNNILNYYPPVQDPVNYTTFIKYLIIFTLFCGGLHICLLLGRTIQLDMNEMIAAKESGLLTKKHDCARNFDLNNCHYEDLVPAAIPFCREWEECIHGPITVNRLELLADYIGSMYYAFFSRLSWQDKIVFISLFSACLWAIKCVLVALVTAYT